MKILGKYFLVVIAGVMFSSTTTQGQSNVAIQPSAIGINGFYNLLKNPLSSTGKGYRSGAAGIAVNYQKGFSRHFVFVTTLSGSILDFVNSNNIDISNGQKQPLLELDLTARYLILQPDHIFKPYLLIGLGGSNYVGYWGSYVPVGLGMQINLTPSSFILFNAQQRIALSINQDDHYYFSIGLAGYIGKSKQNRPAAKLLAPKDTDGDGIYDIDDACPTIPGVIKYRGCPVPDRDGDGINDDVDHCPDVPGVIKYAGCPIPDRDHDGINDEIDHCPDVPGLLRYGGCPIPDRDQDGTNDEEDLCPDKPGPVSNKGCPILTAEIVDKINLAAQNCFFETGKYQILATSFEKLDEVIEILKADSSIYLKIEGYTDTEGNKIANMVLSNNRAKSVMDYLINKGISSKRLSAFGYGGSNPVADNATISGRSKNRRVEIKMYTKYQSDNH